MLIVGERRKATGITGRGSKTVQVINHYQTVIYINNYVSELFEDRGQIQRKFLENIPGILGRKTQREMFVRTLIQEVAGSELEL